MKKNRLILGLGVLAALVALVAWGRDKIHFDFRVFCAQVAVADWRKLVIAIACIYVGYVFRSVRWALLLRHNKRVRPLTLFGTQVIGFTAVALIGRLADPVRPFLVSKKTGLSLSTQVAVYIVERLFDFGAIALIISSVILLAPPGATPHPELLKKAGYGGLVITLLAGLSLVAVRLVGGTVASRFEQVLSLISKKLSYVVSEKIRAFRTGLDTMRSFSDFGIASTLSLSMWALIGLAYLETVRAFGASPQLAEMSLVNCILLLAISGGVSVFQIPVLGWFSQIAFVAAALSSFFGAAPEASIACAATLLLITFLSVVPVGLIWAQFERVSLFKVTVESEYAVEDSEPRR